MKTETPFIICRACGQPIEVTQGPIPMTTPMTDAGNVSPTGETHQPNTGFVRVEELTAALEREQVFRRLWENAALSKSAPDNKAPQALAAKVAETIEWINLGYLWAGGNFNPELANHQVVSDKLREIRELLTALAPYVTAQPAPSPAREGGCPVKIERTCYVCSKCGLVAAYEEQPCPLCAARTALHETELKLTKALVAFSEAIEQRATARQQRDNLHVLHNKSARYSEELRDLCADLRAQLAEARAEAKQWNDLHTAADYEVGALRTLASELAGYIQTRKEELATELHAEVMAGNVVKEYAARSAIAELTALESYRSSTPAPAPAPDKPTHP